MIRIAGIAAIVAVTLGSSVSAATSTKTLSQSTPLAILAPVQAAASQSQPFLAQLEQQDDLFAVQPTHEAAERLAALNSKHEERVHYQTESSSETLAYLHANRDLIAWYVRALLRSRVARLVRDIRQHLRDEKVRDENIPEAVAVAGGPKTVMSGSPSRGRSGTSAGRSFSRAFTAAVRFVEQVTNEGVTAEFEPVSARMKLNTQTTALSADLFSPFLNVGMSYRLLPPERPLPFSGLSPNGQEERLILTGVRSFPELGVVGSVQYQYRHHSLNCSLSKVIAGPVSGQVERSWDFGGTGVMVSRASVSMSVYF